MLGDIFKASSLKKSVHYSHNAEFKTFGIFKIHYKAYWHFIMGYKVTDF